MNKTGYLEFKSFDVHFIYSFFMDFVKIDKTLKDVLDALNKDGNNWHKGRPEERRQVTMNLRVEKKWGENEYFSSIYKKEPGEIKGFSDKNLISNYETVDMDYEIVTRIFDTGAGTVNIKLGFKRKNGAFNSLDIHNIFNLADTGIQNSDVRIPSLTLFPDGKSEKGKKLFEIFFVECTSIEKVLKNISKSFNTTNEEETLWLDREFINMNMNKTDWQNPYVVTIGKLKEDSSSEKSLWWHYSLEDLRDKLETRKKYREAATLLFRFLIGREYISEGLQDDVYIPADLQGKDTFLRNFGWHRDIFVGFHPRASLILANEASNERKPSTRALEILKDSLIDLMELIRSRWHISIAINALLDKDIEILKNEPSQDNLKFLLNLIKRRKLFALFLSDPIPYSFEGGTIGDINEVARNEFFLDHLKEMTYKKFEVVDRLYKDQMESIRISQFDTFEKEMQEMREKSKDYLDFLKKESKESARMP